MKTFYLKHPVSLGERTITELTLQDPHVRHLMRTDAYGVNTIAADVLRFPGNRKRYWQICTLKIGRLSVLNCKKYMQSFSE